MADIVMVVVMLMVILVVVGGGGDPRRVLIHNTAPKTSKHLVVLKIVFHGPFEGHTWIRCGFGSHEATPMFVFSERGCPTFA